MTAANLLGLYSEFLACKAIFFKSSSHPKFTVDTIFYNLGKRSFSSISLSRSFKFSSLLLTGTSSCSYFNMKDKLIIMIFFYFLFGSRVFFIVLMQSSNKQFTF